MERTFTPYSSSTSSKTYCNICYAPYNLDNNKPLLICHQNHSMCKECLKSIRRNLRCPFCRENIRPNYIRLNKAVVELIKAKQKNKIDKKRFIKVVQNDRLSTNADDEEFVEVSDLFPAQRTVVINNLQGQNTTVLKILLFLQLFFFQVPFGVYSFYCGLFFLEETCFFNKVGMESVYLRDILLTEGYISCMVGMLAIYFTVFNHMRLLAFRHLACFYVLLLVIIMLKSSVFAIVYVQMIRSRTFIDCSLNFKNFTICNTCVNVIQLMLGLCLIRRLLQNAFRR